MGQVIVRNLEDQVIKQHKRLAKSRGVSLEAQLREVLRQAARPSAEELIAESRRIRAMSLPLPKGVKPVEGWKLIREDRDNDEPYR